MKHIPLLAVWFSVSCLLRAEIPIKSGDRVAFLGDSITQQGQGSPGGYVQLVGSGLAANGIKIEIIGAGISGHKSNQMLERLERDVLSKKPQWMTLSCGVNDVWHGARGVPLEDYKKNITAIIDQAQAAGVKVVVLTSTMIKENQETPENQKLVAYNDFLRAVAAEKKCLLADLNADMQAAIAEAAKARPAKGNYLTSDGVHMAAAGNLMMATGVLKGLGLNTAELAKAKEAWLDVPDFTKVAARTGITQRQMQQLEKLAAASNTTVEQLVEGEFSKLVNSLLESAR
jgi:lysophospholipase L1-like esterase